MTVATGLAFLAFPLLFVFGFAAHPGLRHPHVITNPDELISRAHGNRLLQVGHVAVLAACPLLIVIAAHYAGLLQGSSANVVGLTGVALAVVGVVLLAADKGALCLTMSALDTLPEREFGQFGPGLHAMFGKQGWMVLLWGVLLLPVGFVVLAIVLLATGTLPVWQATALLLGSLLLMVPDGMELIDVVGCVLLGVAMVPTGIALLGA